MAFRLAALLVLAFSATSSRAQFEGTAELRMVVTHQGEEVASSLRFFYTRTAWRMEMDVRPPDTSSPGARHELGGHETFRLVAFGKISDPSRSWIVNDRTKTYAVMVIDPATRPTREDPDAWTVSRAGKDAVAGLACEKVTALRKDQSESWEACLSDDVPRTAMESLNNIDDEGWVAAAHRAGVTGRPIRAVSRGHDGSERCRWEFVRFERAPLPASLFTIPAGYRETSVFRAMVAQGPEQERAMHAVEKHMTDIMKDLPPEQRKMMEQMTQEPRGKKP